MDISFFLKKIDFESGVTVSVNHLCRCLDDENIKYEIIYYENDEDLYEKAIQCTSKCINLQVPSFGDEVLKKILKVKDNVVISIHSTLCNLQVEEGSLGRLLEMGNSDYQNLRFTCPAQCECDGLNALVKREYLYLPNTFSYPCDDIVIAEKTKEKRTLNRTLKISLVCAYRPLKNMITQVAAVIMLAKEYDLELHLFDSNFQSPVYKDILAMAKYNNLKIVMHPQMKNFDCFQEIADFDLGLQVSLSETFSYVAFEHMIQGIPVVGSDSVRFSSEIVTYSDVNEICRGMKKILENDDIYEKYRKEARIKALEVQKQNNKDAVNTIRKMICCP
ncbi:MAG: hypothetical protein IKW30_09235 [Lachnospiraceae bacterium]|nr:hypothetical protein [Lachnospiraceae bacterium]